MLINIKIIRLVLFLLYVSSVHTAYLEHHPKTILSNAHRCYKEGLYDISFDLCQSYVTVERLATVAMNIPGVNVRILLGLNV